MKIRDFLLAVALALPALLAEEAFGSWGVVDVGGGEGGLAAYYPFDGNANDESGNGNDGHVAGATLTYDRNGNANGAYNFDGQGDYIEVDNTNGNLSLTGAFSILAWVKPSSETVLPIVEKVADNDGNDDNYHLWYLGGRGRFLFNIEEASSDDDFTASTSDDFPPGAWYFVAGVYNGVDLILYVNGVEADRISVGAIIPYTGSEPLRIGNSLNTDHDDRAVFSGDIDGIAIYNRALSAGEIEELSDNNHDSSSGTDDTGDTDGNGDYDSGYQDGMEYCANNPESCGISVSGCTSSGSAGTVTADLDIYIPSLDYESLLGTINIHANFEYEGQDSMGKHIWSLREYGSNSDR